MQIIGAFLINMIMGSGLNWSIIKPYAEIELNADKQYQFHTSYLIITLNIGMLAKICLNRVLDRKKKTVLLIVAILIYTVCIVLMGFIKNMSYLLNVLPNIYVFFLGLLLLEPLDEMLNEDPLEFDKQICLFCCGLSFGWLIFGIVIQMLINPSSIAITDDNRDQFHFKRGCLIYALLIFVAGAIGIYMFRPRYSTIDEEFDSREHIRESEKKRDVIHNTFIEKKMLMDQQFYFLMFQFSLLFTPAIGSLNYLNQEKENLFAIYCVVGIAITIGSLLPLLLKQPYQISTILAIAQIGMMIAINLLGVVYSHIVFKLISLGLQFLLFGFVLSFSVLIIQTVYDNVVDNLPITFIAMTLTVISQYLLFLFLGDKKLIQLIEFSLIVISYLCNIFVNK